MKNNAELTDYFKVTLKKLFKDNNNKITDRANNNKLTTDKLIEDRIELLTKKLLNVFDTVKEAHFINETLNHMVYEFNKIKMCTQGGINTTLYDKSEIYYSNNFIKSPVYSGDKPSVEHWATMIGMITILNELRENKDKPTKFCLFACVRREIDEKYKTASENTLLYAEKLSKPCKFTFRPKESAGGKRRQRNKTQNNKTQNNKTQKNKSQIDVEFKTDYNKTQKNRVRIRRNSNVNV